MKFSEKYKIKQTAKDVWFDPVLSIDTKLFIDPFLLYAKEEGRFEGSHIEVIAFFNSIFKLIAQAKGNRASVLWRKAVDSLQFPEVEELCLGYTGAGTTGSGSGRLLAGLVAQALWEAIQSGLKEITHFEEVCILSEGIGADRISDITANLIRYRLAAYTNDICMHHKIPTDKIRYRHGIYNISEERWEPIEVELPRNLYNGKPILLVPRRYLRDLPTVNPDDFWEYCYSNENQTLRNEYSYDVTKRVSKRDIIAFARRHPEIRIKYLSNLEKHPPNHYDFIHDPQGLVKWYDATASYCQQYPLAVGVQSQAEFVLAIDKMINKFQHYVEENRGWKLLWNENKTPKKEDAAQILLLGVIKHYCHANNIDISREPNIGRGPVDFKVSSGFKLRALIELKLVKNSKFWSGLEKQLPTYQNAEEIDIGYFLVVVYTKQDLKKVGEIETHLKKINEKTGYQINVVVVDARSSPTSASKL